VSMGHSESTWMAWFVQMGGCDRSGLRGALVGEHSISEDTGDML